MRPVSHLKVVRDLPAGDASRGRAPAGDAGLVAALFGIAVVPVAGALAGIGSWSPRILGFAAGAALLTGRELWAQLRAAARGPPPRT